MQTFTNENGAEVVVLDPAELPLFLAEVERQAARDEAFRAEAAAMVARRNTNARLERS